MSDGLEQVLWEGRSTVPRRARAIRTGRRSDSPIEPGGLTGHVITDDALDLLVREAGAIGRLLERQEPKLLV